MTDFDIFERTKLLIGGDNVERLKNSKVLVFGLGGVGSYVVEALARAGIGTLDIVDRDTVTYSNINRQLIALFSTIGTKKTDAVTSRLLDINPDIKINSYFISYGEETADLINFENYDYIVDAIDTVKSKLLIASRAQKANVPLISSMGTGFKLDPSRLKITDIYSTTVCPLARLMRKELRDIGIDCLKVLFSDEPPTSAVAEENKNAYANTNLNTIERNAVLSKKQQCNSSPCASAPNGEATDTETSPNIRPVKNVASISFVPSVAGLLIAAEVIKDLINK